MSTHALLNLYNELRKGDKMHFIPFSQQLIEFNKFNTFLYNKKTNVIFYFHITPKLF